MVFNPSLLNSVCSNPKIWCLRLPIVEHVQVCSMFKKWCSIFDYVSNSFWLWVKHAFLIKWCFFTDMGFVEHTYIHGAQKRNGLYCFLEFVRKKKGFWGSSAKFNILSQFLSFWNYWIKCLPWNKSSLTALCDWNCQMTLKEWNCEIVLLQYLRNDFFHWWRWRRDNDFDEGKNLPFFVRKMERNFKLKIKSSYHVLIFNSSQLGN